MFRSCQQAEDGDFQVEQSCRETCRASYDAILDAAVRLSFPE